MAQPSTELVIRGKRIAQDEHGFLSLNDVWRLSGEKGTKSPSQWRKLPTTRELIEALEQTSGFSTSIAEGGLKSAIYALQGRGGGTFAHVILALAYCEYLDPQLGIEVREIALRYWSGDLSLFDDFIRRREEQVVEDGRRVALRDRIREHNSILQFRILHGLGARNAGQYAEFHNSGYRGMYDGEDENAIHQRKQLKPEQRILDHMGSLEASANWFRTSVAEERLRNLPVETLLEASRTHTFVGKEVREFLKRMGARMPEELPTADNIADAKKRLRNYERGQKRLK